MSDVNLINNLQITYAKFMIYLTNRVFNVIDNRSLSEDLELFENRKFSGPHGGALTETLYFFS